MTYGTLCSGIEAPTLAWQKLGFEPLWFAENAPFPSAVLSHHYPSVLNLGDINLIQNAESVKLICGGTPCQSFSKSGFRKGLDDPRGNLALVFLRIVNQVRPRWVIWENVPGVLSSGKGRDFGSFLSGLGQIGYGWSYRVLDAQYFGLAQRRKRVFVVGCSDGWQRAAAVLFDFKSLQGCVAPSRKKGESFTYDIAPSLRSSGPGTRRVGCRDASDPLVATVTPDVALTLTATKSAGTLNDRNAQNLVVSGTQLTSKNNRSNPKYGDPACTITAQSKAPFVFSPTSVRRLMPIECERLQGLPDDYTRIAWKSKPASRCPDGLRYEAIGNSIAVDVLEWIGKRLKFVDSI